MNCVDALDRMLTADPETLSGGTGDDPPLAAHLRSCNRCRAVAATLTTELQSLDAGLEALGSERRPRAHVLDKVPPARHDGRRWRWSGAWVPLAAAAALAGVLVLGRSAPRAGAPSAPLGVEEAATARGERVAVVVPADGGAAVLNTTNPRITVVWFYERSER